MDGFEDDSEKVICLGAMSPQKMVRLFAEGTITKEQALQMLHLLAGDDAKFMGLNNWADSEPLKERYEAFFAEIENHETAKKEAKGALEEMKFASPQEVLGAFEGGKIKKEMAYQILIAMKTNEIEEETRRADGGSAMPSEHGAHEATAALRAKRRYGEFSRLLYETADRKERTAELTRKMKGAPSAGTASKTPGLVRRS